jgi:hypothetical protein
MAYLTDEAVTALAGGVEKRDRQLDKIKRKALEHAQEARGLAGVAGGTLLFSYLDGSLSDDGSEWKLFNFAPASLVAAAALHGLAWAGYAGKLAPDAHSVGTGALAAYLSNLGRDLGRKSRTKPARHGTAGQYGAGALPQPGQRYAVDGVPGYAAAYGG